MEIVDGKVEVVANENRGGSRERGSDDSPAVDCPSPDAAARCLQYDGAGMVTQRDVRPGLLLGSFSLCYGTT